MIFKNQTKEDVFFTWMFPRNNDSISKRLNILEAIHPDRIVMHRKNIDRYLNQYPMINETISTRIEYYFQTAYFNNFKEKYIAFKSAGLLINSFVIIILVLTNLGITAFGYDYLRFSQEYSFLKFYLLFSLILTPITILITVLQFLIIGVILSFISLFDNSGKIRRFSVHLDEMVRSLKPGGRKAEVGLMSNDELDGFYF